MSCDSRFLMALVLGVAAADAQTPLIRGTVKGPSGQPISGLEVRLDPGAVKTSTGPDGAFAFQQAQPGDYLLTVTGKGYVPWQETLAVQAAKPAVLALVMDTVQTTIEVREPSDDFLATNSVSVTKGPQRLLDLPYSIQVIPKALLEDRAIQDVKDLYRNISGVSDSPYSAMLFRGFTQREVLFNGLRGNPYGSLDNDVNDAGFSTSQGRLTNIEFVEVLKGPSAVLFGAGEPGGIVNFVTKKPRTQTAAEASFRMGSFRQLGGHGEVTGPLSKQRGLFYRAAWFQEDRKVFRYGARNENFHGAAGLTWKFKEATSLGFEYEYVDQLLPGHRLRGIPVNAAGVNLAAREWTASEPTDFSALQARIFQARVDHAFTPFIRTDGAFRFLNYDRPERYHEPRGINADGRTMRREFRDQFRSNDDWAVSANLHWRIPGRAAGVHNLVVGFESVRQDWSGRFATARDSGRGGPVPNLDLFAPVYGRGFAGSFASFAVQTVQARRVGVFGQDQIEITPRLQVMLGGRVEGFEDQGRDGALPLQFSTSAVTGRAGLVYRLAPRVSAFGSFSNSFNRAPSLAQTASANGPHQPETGRQFEAGVKSELSNGRVLFTGSYFHITKENVLRPDPNFGPTGDNFLALLAVGKVRSQGLEFDATGRLTPNLSVVANYAFLDSEILEDRFTRAAIGRPLPNAARHAFGLFARYDVKRTRTAFTVGTEARGRRFEPYAGIQAAGYAIWDFGVFQRLHRWVELRAQLDNAADRTYATSSLFAARAGNWPGAPRTFTVSLHFNTLTRD